MHTHSRSLQDATCAPLTGPALLICVDDDGAMHLCPSSPSLGGWRSGRDTRLMLSFVLSKHEDCAQHFGVGREGQFLVCLCAYTEPSTIKP